jgi:hypothetical protein
MSNRVDFYQGEYKALAIPARRCEVFVEGMPRAFLEVAEIVREEWPKFGRALLRHNPATAHMSKSVSIAKAERTAAIGKRIGICQLVDVGIGEVKIEPVWLFAGKVEDTQARLGAGEQELEITVRDISARLGRITVSGRRITTAGGESTFNDGLECVFNENGQPNASIQQIQHNGRSYTVFAGEGQEAKYWSVAEVLIYLLSEYLPFGQLQVPPAAYLEAITNEKIADELDADGKSILDALGDCCEQAELKFCFRPRQQELGPAEKIVFYPQGEGPSVELNLQYASEQLSISRTNVCELASQKQNEPADSGVIEMIDVQTPILATHFEVGDRVATSPDSRDVLGVRRDSRSIFWIDRVRIDFEKQCTDLRILRKSMVQ